MIDPSLLGPVAEFTISLTEEVVQAALSSPAARRAPEPAHPVATSSPGPAETVPPDVSNRFVRPRPGSRALPQPRSGSASAATPLTTGVVPAPLTTGVVQPTPDASPPRDPPVARPNDAAPLVSDRSRVRSQLPTFEPSSPDSRSLPEVPMPQADTGRARPLRPSPLRPPPARHPGDQRPAPPPEPAAAAPPPPPPPPAPPPAAVAGPVSRSVAPPPTPRDPEADLSAPKTGTLPGPAPLEELLTLADEPPEREDTVSGTIELAAIGDLPDRPPAASPEPVSAGGLTGSLELVDAEPGPAEPAEPVVAAPAPAEPVAAAPPAPATPAPAPAEATPAAAAAPAEPLPEPTLPEPLADPEPTPAGAARVDDATRPLPAKDVEAAMALIAATRGPDAKVEPAKPEPAPAAKAKKAASKPAREPKVDPKKADEQYREPVLAWLASLFGLVVIGGLLFLLLIIVLMILS